jgi:RNA polymerase sigma-70 factor (ECF subfamily)
MNSTEKQLINKLKDGDNESFNILFNQYGKRIYNFAFKMCGNKEDADDIVQSTFIQVITNINGFREESGLYTWLYKIAKNQCFRLLEKRRKTSFTSLDHLVNMDISIESSDDYDDLEKQYYINEVKEGCLLGLLRCLPLYQRVAFILNILLDIKTKETAVIINKSETATRLLVHRARYNIKSFLCRNCYYFDKNNPCHCEKLINFSLKQGWVQEHTGNKLYSISTVEIENEVNELKKLTILYNSLKECQPSEDSICYIKDIIKNKQFRILK